jgi:hypothetical protein
MANKFEIEVARAIERAEREQAEHLAALRAKPARPIAPRGIPGGTEEV